MSGSEVESRPQAARSSLATLHREDEGGRPTRGRQKPFDNRKPAPTPRTPGRTVTNPVNNPNMTPVPSTGTNGKVEGLRQMESVLCYKPSSRKVPRNVLGSSGASSKEFGTCDPITSVWQNRHVQKSSDGNSWICRLCGKTAAGVNASKALIHLSHTKG